MTTISAVSPPETPAAGRQRSWLILIVLLAGQFMARLDVTVGNNFAETTSAGDRSSG